VNTHAAKKGGAELILARLKTQTLDATVLDALTQQTKRESDGSLNQSHYYVEGSFEERVNKVGVAFRKWCDDRDFDSDSENYYWYGCNVLAVYTDSLIFCFYKAGDYCYRQVGYSVDASGIISLDSEPTPVDVKMVVETLTANEETQKTMPNTTTPVKQDEVVDNHTVRMTAPVEHSDQGDSVNVTAATDAADTSVSVPDPSDDAIAAHGVEHSGDEGAGPIGEAGVSASPVLDVEMSKTAAGLKGDNPASPGKNVDVNQQSKVGNPEFLLQTVGLDKLDNSFCQILKQSTEDVEGTKLLHIQGVATRAEILSKNGYVYPREVWQSNLDQMNASATAGKFIGKLEHPDQEQGLKSTAIRFTDFWMQGDDVMFKAVVLDTEEGKELQALIAGGVQIDMSSRGYGSAQKQSWRGQEVQVIQSDFTCTAFDAVHHGASTGSSISTAQYQSDKPADNGIPETEMANTKPLTPQEQQAEARANEINQSAKLSETRVNLIAQSGLSVLGNQAFKKALDTCETLADLIQKADTILPSLVELFPKATDEAVTQSVTEMPHFYVKQSADETAPQTCGELIDRMVADLSDKPFGQNAQGVPNHFNSMREACRRVMQNTARTVSPGFHGPSAILGLLALEQGKVSKASDILTQSLQDGATIADGNASGGGAPLSAPMIFPLIRRLFPRYIVNEIASIQPMDRPAGKIFFLDQYRYDDPDGSGLEKRIDLNTSGNPLNSSFADNNVEGSEAAMVRLRLTSVSVDAHTKKLGAAWSVEEMQDLRAYHGLDAATELMNGVARETALEWNLEVLNDMLAQASAASLTFGTNAPAAGFPNQTDWDAYIWNYIQKLDNAIFSKRQNPMTHLVCGTDAALTLAKSVRFTAAIGGENGGDMDQQYPGTVYYGSIATPTGSRYKIFKTNFWGSGTANSKKILGLRRGEEWSDTPYIFAPYRDFSQKQGIVSRAAKKVVVGDAMGVLTVAAETGVILS